MKNKGLVSLIFALIIFASTMLIIDYDNTPLATIFAPSIPNQIYQPINPKTNEKIVCIVFDDGWKSSLSAIPILQSFGFTATYAIVTSYTSYPDYVNWKDIRNIANAGMDIASHSRSHIDLSNSSWDEMHEELAISQQILRSRGYPANVFVYPYGPSGNNETVQSQVAKYYLVARGTVEGKCDLSHCNRFNLEAYDVYHGVSMEDFTEFLEGTNGNNITILYYHKIDNGIEDTSVSKKTFQVQMQHLFENGYTIKNLSQIFLNTVR